MIFMREAMAQVRAVKSHKPVSEALASSSLVSSRPELLLRPQERWRLSRGGGLIGLREGDLTQRARELQGALFEAVAAGLRPCSGALRRCD